MNDAFFQKLGLDNLLDSDMTSYEFFCGLPRDIQRRVILRDVGTFSELAEYVAGLRRGRIKDDEQTRTVL